MEELKEIQNKEGIKIMANIKAATKKSKKFSKESTAKAFKDIRN